MAIVFHKQKKFQRSLIYIFAGVILITIIVIWYGFFREEEISPPEEAILMPQREVRVDFNFLESSILKRFQPFSAIEPLEEEIGRENPFLPQ